jgi:DNA-binding beta-propeller fold protein YncE
VGVALGRDFIYAVDAANNQVRKLDPQGHFVAEIGARASGRGRLNGPQGVALDPQGNILVADTANDRIVKFAPNGSVLATWGAKGGSGPPGAGPGELRGPTALLVNPAGDVLIADTGNNRIEELRPDGSFLDAWGGLGSRPGRFHQPTGLALDRAGNVYVVDRGNNRVEKFDAHGHYLSGWGTRGTRLGQFVHPAEIEIDCAGNIYVSDTGNNRVERFRPLSPPASVCLASARPASHRGPPHPRTPAGKAGPPARDNSWSRFGT